MVSWACRAGRNVPETGPECDRRRLGIALRRVDEVSQEGATFSEAIGQKQVELGAIDGRLAAGREDAERATMEAVADALASECIARARDDIASDSN